MASASDIQRICFERLIGAALSVEPVTELKAASNDRKQYSLQPDQVNILRDGLFPASISTARISPVMSSVQRTDGYCMDVGCAFIYGGLQDFRAVTGESRPAILLSERPNKEQ